MPRFGEQTLRLLVEVVDSVGVQFWFQVLLPMWALSSPKPKTCRCTKGV